jgi:hypothetical protein
MTSSPAAYSSVDAGINLQHLELLHHFVTNTYTTMSDDPEILESWRGPVIRIGFNCPFFLLEMLAVSALHLAHLRPEQAHHYYTISTELQSQALTNFTVQQLVVDETNCAAVLLFTSFMAFHVLADPSRRNLGNSETSHQYIDHVIDSITLVRNAKKLVIEDWIEYLQGVPELRPVFTPQAPPRPFQGPQPIHVSDDFPCKFSRSKHARPSSTIFVAAHHSSSAQLDDGSDVPTESVKSH